MLNWQEQYLSRRRDNTGSILILALWALFFLGALAVVISAYIRPHLSVAGTLRDRAKTYYIAKAGVEIAILEMANDETDSYDTLKDSWSTNENFSREIELGDGTFTIHGLVDEERKININRSPYAVLKNFLMIAGETTSQQANIIADSIIDWRDEDEKSRPNGAESGYYSEYGCKNGNFQVLEELLLVRGMDYGIFNRIRDRITVYGIGAVNINTADTTVLHSLGMSMGLADKVARFRERNAFEAVGTIRETLSGEALSGEEIGQLNSVLNAGLLSVRSDNFMGESVGKLENSGKSTRISFVFHRNIVFNRNKTIKYWRTD